MRSLLCAVCVLIVCLPGALRSAADESQAQEDRQKLLAERNRLANEAQRFVRQGQFDECVSRLERMLELEKQVFGPTHDEVLDTWSWLSRVHRARNDFAKQQEALKEIVEIRRGTLGAEHWQTGDARRALEDAKRQSEMTSAERADIALATSFNSGVVTLWNAGRSREALPLARQAAEIRQRLLGNEHPDYAESLFNLAAQFLALHSYTQAEPLYVQARDIYRKALGEEHPDYAMSLHNLAFLYKNMGSYAQAEPLYLQARDIRRKSLGEEHNDYATTLNHLALLYQAMDSYAQAEPLFVQALDITRKARGEEHRDYAASLSCLAGLYQDMGSYAQAEPLFVQALEITRKARGEEHPDYATSLSSLAGLYRAMGSYARAEPLYAQARDIYRQALGEEDPRYVTSLNRLASLYQTLGSYAQAELLLVQARDIRRKAPGEEHPDYATSLNSLAMLYQAIGSYAQAEPLFVQARDIRRKALGEEHNDYATSLSNLAMLYKAMGSYAQAEPLLVQARDITRKALGEEHRDYATSLGNLAGLYWAMGSYARAEPLDAQARDITRKALGEDHPDYALSLNNLASLYLTTGSYTQAEPLFAQARDIFRKALGEEHPYYAASLENLALLCHATGSHDQAEPLGREAVSAKVAAARKALPALSNAQALDWLAEHPLQLGLCLTSPAGQDLPPVEQVSRDVWETRSLATRLLAQTRPQPDASPEARRVFTELQAARKRLSQLALAVPMPEQAESHRQALVKAAEEKERLEKEAAQASQAAARAKLLRDAKIEDLLPLLPEKSAVAMLIQSISWNRVLREQAGGKGGPPSYTIKAEWVYDAFLLRQDAAGQAKLARERLGAVEPIFKALLAWRQELTKSKASREGERRAEASRQELRERVWEKIEPHLAGCEMVVLIPEGALTALPWAALPGRKPGTLLLEDYALATASYPQQLVDWLSREPSQAQGLALVGGVQYDQRPKTRVPEKAAPIPLASVERSAAVEEVHAWHYLQGTRQEAESIASLFRQFKQGEAELLFDHHAGEDAVAEAIQSSRYIHLATHGFFAKPREKKIFQRDLRQQRLFEAEVAGGHRSGSLAGRNPLLLSGVTLAGANLGPVKDEHGVPSGEDGILTAEEVESLSLEQAELVVLSACETGLGEDGYRDEGVFGLQRAFHQAGARTVIASLWKVDDAATQTLMAEFYRNLWEKKLSKLEALRQAQLAMIQGYHPEARQLERGRIGRLKPAGPLAPAPAAPSDNSRPMLPPYYWAAFVLSGDWR